MAWKIDENKSLFSIGTVAQILGVKPRMLRLYEEHGLLLPIRSDTNRRLYSLKDINFIAYLNYLSTVKKVNLAGITEIQRIIMRMPEDVRSSFMAEIEEIIHNLPSDRKIMFENPAEEEIEKALKEVPFIKLGAAADKTGKRP